MIKSLGIDIIENNRFDNLINDPDFIKRILSSKEIIVYENISNEMRKREYLASRFSAKESLIKALGKSLINFKYTDVSILNNEDGSPYVLCDFFVDGTILLSISHSRDYSITQVIIQK